MWHWGIHSGVNRGGEPRQSILIRVQQSGDQSRRWRCCGAGEALTWAALQIRPAQQRWPSETLTPRFYHLSLSFHSPPPSHVPDCIVSSSPPRSLPNHPLSILITFSSFISLPPLSSPVPPYISVSYPPSVICCLAPPTSHSFSLPQSNSRSFIGIIRWIWLSLRLSVLQHLSHSR